MKRMIPVVLTVALLLWFTAGLAASPAQAAEEVVIFGFKTLPFGATYEETVQFLKQTFPNNSLAVSAPDSLTLKQFDLGPLKVDVVFGFNHEKRFSGFSMLTAMKEQYLEEQVMNDHQVLKSIFSNKYGTKPSCKDSIVIYDGVQCAWRDKLLTIATGFKTGNWKYGAYGLVESKKMAQEEEAYRKKQAERKDGKTTSPF